MVLGFIGLGFSRNRNLEPTEDNLQKEIDVSHETVRKARGSIVNELTTAAPPNSSVAGKAEEEEMSARHLSAELWKPEDDDRLRALSALGPPGESDVLSSEFEAAISRLLEMVATQMRLGLGKGER